MFRLKNIASEPKGILNNVFFNFAKIFLNIGVPLITIPYVSRVLGVEDFGTVNYYMAIIAVLSVLSSFGLPTYAVSKLNVDLSRDEVEDKALHILRLRINLFSVFSFFLVSFFVFNDSGLLIPVFLILIAVFGEIISCDWFFISMRQQKLVFLRTLCSRVAFVLLIFAFVDGSDGALRYLTIFSLLSLLIGLVSFFIIFEFQDKTKARTKVSVRFKDVFFIFIAILLSSIFGKFDLVLLSSLIGEIQFGYFSSAYKLIAIVLTIVTSISMVVIPFLNDKKDSSPTYNSLVTSIIFQASISIFLFFWFFNIEIVNLVYGQSFHEASAYLKILSLMIIFVPFYNAVIYQVLLINKKLHIAIVLFFIGIVTGFISLIFLNDMYQYTYAIIIANSVIFVLSLIYYFLCGFRMYFSLGIVFSILGMAVINSYENFDLYSRLGFSICFLMLNFYFTTHFKTKRIRQ